MLANNLLMAIIALEKALDDNIGCLDKDINDDVLVPITARNTILLSFIHNYLKEVAANG